MENKTLLSQLRSRGCIHSVSHFEELEKLLDNERLVFYCGFDPTSASLHVGHMVPLLLMRRLQRAGHTPIALVGTGTGMIGDPSGKSEERVLLSEEAVKENIAGIESHIALFLSPDGDNAFQVVRNDEWLRHLGFIDFLRDIGKHFSVNAMMAKESVRSRLENREQGISYTEFSYMLLQAYDFYHLNREKNCRLQVGGSDQWGNITAGLELIRRLSPEGNPAVYGLTFPLLTTSTGAKFGKTEKGTVWLSPDRTSPYDFYQYWLNTADADSLTYLRLFTDLCAEELLELEEALSSHPEERQAQKTLAAELTTVVHGPAETAKAVSASQVLFGGSLSGLDSKTLLGIFSDVPSTSVARGDLSRETTVLDLAVMAGAAASKGAARRLAEGGGLYLNNKQVSDPKQLVSLDDFINGEVALIRSGKKKYYLVRLNA